MRILLLEMKKIWRGRILLLVALLCGLYSVLFMDFYVGHISITDHPGAETTELAGYMLDHYGATLEPDEFDEFMRLRPQFVAEANQYIAEMPVFRDAGIYNYDDIVVLSQNLERSEAEERAYWVLGMEQCNYVGYRIQAIDSIAENYTSFGTRINTMLYDEPLTASEQIRVREIVSLKEYYSVFPDIIEYTKDYFKYLAVLCVLTSLILTSPLVTLDRARKMNQLQYASATGRGILTRQLFATLISSLLLTLILFVIFGLLFTRAGTMKFLRCDINGFIGNSFTHIPITYGGYIGVLLVLSLVAAIASSALAFVFSRFSDSLVTLIFKLIPFFVAVDLVSVLLVFNRPLMIGTSNALTDFGLYAILLFIGVAVAALALRRERRVDI
ncbi:MAG: hypothetical protein LBN26_03210 [Christensenellaceae bacterium]|jgi:hypothetical protein|nr:hypothetical protein [Christensenellaceae bacterium]